MAYFFLLFRLRSHLKNSCSGFHQGFETPRNGRVLLLCPDETLALVFDMLHQTMLMVVVWRFADTTSYFNEACR